MVPSTDDGIQIYVRNKRLADMTTFRPDRTVLYVHGATFPSALSIAYRQAARIVGHVHFEATAATDQANTIRGHCELYLINRDLQPQSNISTIQANPTLRRLFPVRCGCGRREQLPD